MKASTGPGSMGIVVIGNPSFLVWVFALLYAGIWMAVQKEKGKPETLACLLIHKKLRCLPAAREVGDQADDETERGGADPAEPL